MDAGPQQTKTQRASRPTSKAASPVSAIMWPIPCRTATSAPRSCSLRTPPATTLRRPFYAATRYLSWRTIIIGDPLASPYARNSPRQAEERIDRFLPPPNADQVPELPGFFAKRRQLYLTQKYSTSPETVNSLLQAEAAAAGGDDSAALPLVETSLERDPSIAESHLLKAQIIERAGDFPRSFEHLSEGSRARQHRPRHLSESWLALPWTS